jgi:hypothetical protein
MTRSSFEIDLTLEKTFSGNVLDSFGFECDSERSNASDDSMLSDDSGQDDDCEKTESHVESEQLPHDQPHDNYLISYVLQDVSRILPLSPIGSMVLILTDKSTLVQGQLTARFKT